jgi:hypothetical protein
VEEFLPAFFHSRHEARDFPSPSVARNPLLIVQTGSVQRNGELPMQTNRQIKLLLIASLCMATISPAHSCTLIPGYFYQVTSLKGQVVGSQNFILQSIPWLRQSLGRNRAELTLQILPN